MLPYHLFQSSPVREFLSHRVSGFIRRENERERERKMVVGGGGWGLCERGGGGLGSISGAE